MHVVGTAGHVDHGKSTLITALTGIDPDRFEEEKRRGLTIDLGFAWLELPSGNEIGIIDVPGHERFIRNMLAGAGGTSICLFVVAANEGWSRQSAEHLAILDVLGVTHGVVAITKSDLADADQLRVVTEDVRSRIDSSTLRGIPIVTCSASKGTGLAELVDTIDHVVSNAPPVPDRGTPRLWIDRAFTIAGAGTVVTGTLMDGELGVGQSVSVVRADIVARIRSIQSHKREHEAIGPGHRVALNLTGAERSGVERGDAVVQKDQWVTSSKVHAVVRVVDPQISGSDHELTERGAHLLYTGTAETPVQIRLIDKNLIGSGGSAFAELTLRDALPLKRGDRFVLRDVGRVLTFGGGRILDPLPVIQRRDARLLPLLEALASEDDARAATALVAAQGMMSEKLMDLRIGPVPEDAEVEHLGSWLVSPHKLNSLKNDLVTTLETHHREEPLARGMPKELARRTILQDAPDALDALIATVPAITAEGDVLKLAAHRISLTPDQERRRATVLETIAAGGFTPPLADDLDADAALLRALVDSGDLVKIGPFYLTAEQANSARTSVRNRIEEIGPATVAQIRDLLATSRKYAVPLCEWLDETGATRRKGDVRVLGPNP